MHVIDQGNLGFAVGFGKRYTVTYLKYYDKGEERLEFAVNEYDTERRRTTRSWGFATEEECWEFLTKTGYAVEYPDGRQPLGIPDYAIVKHGYAYSSED